MFQIFEMFLQYLDTQHVENKCLIYLDIQKNVETFEIFAAVTSLQSTMMTVALGATS